MINGRSQAKVDEAVARLAGAVAAANVRGVAADVATAAGCDALVDEDQVAALKQRALSPDHPSLHGSAQNPDVFFQAREAASPFYAAVPRLLEEAMLRFARRTGRSYQPFEYLGDPRAERVIVAMGSATATIEAAVRRLNLDGERVGLVKVRLYRPFSSRHR